MQNYYIENGKIIVTNLNEFNVVHILECGQVFRYKKFDGYYEIYSTNKKAKLIDYSDRVEILTDDVDYFVNYFDLDTNYTLIKQKLGEFDVLTKMINSAYGIRILRQNKFEMIISFIISANNNIKRIQMIIESLCSKFGTNMGDFYAFPTREQLLKASVEDFKNCGAGYRAEYLYKVVRELENFDYSIIENSKSTDCLPILLKLSGVGPKVADCILLFGFYKQDVFPVDTWIIKVYNDYFAKTPSFDVKFIRKELTNIFKNLSGYAQQYLFYYKRVLEDN